MQRRLFTVIFKEEIKINKNKNINNDRYLKFIYSYTINTMAFN